VSYSKVPHAFLEAICSVVASNARTKDLVWLVYRHTVGRNGGRWSDPWQATTGSLREALQIPRSTLQRCLREAVALGLLSAEREGYLWQLNISPTCPSAGTLGDPTCPSAGQSNPSAGTFCPSAGQSNPSAGQLNPSAGSIRDAAIPLRKEKNKKEKKRFPTSIQPLPSELRQPFLYSIRTKQIELSHIDEHYTALNEQIEIAYLAEDRERLQALNTWRIKVEVTEHPL